MQNVSLNTKRYELPSGFKVPSVVPFPSRKINRNTPGSTHYTSYLFQPVPDQTPHEKALLQVPESRVQENIISDYTKQAKAAEKTKLDGLKLDKDIVFETFKKLGSKGKKRKAEPLKKSKKVTPPKKNKKALSPNFAIST